MNENLQAYCNRLDEIFEAAKYREDIKYLEYNGSLKRELLFSDVHLETDILSAYIHLNQNHNILDPVSIDEAKEVAEQVMSEDYVLFRSVVFYRNKEELVDLARLVLEKRLDTPEYLNKYFSKEDLIEILVQKKTKDELIDELLVSNSMETLIEFYPAIAYTTEDNTKIYYGYVDCNLEGRIPAWI